MIEFQSQEIELKRLDSRVDELEKQKLFLLKKLEELSGKDCRGVIADMYEHSARGNNHDNNDNNRNNNNLLIHTHESNLNELDNISGETI